MEFDDNFTKEDWREEMLQDEYDEDREEARREAKHEYLMRTDPEYVNKQQEFIDLVEYLHDFKKFCVSYDLDFTEMVDLAKDSM